MNKWFAKFLFRMGECTDNTPSALPTVRTHFCSIVLVLIDLLFGYFLVFMKIGQKIGFGLWLPI